MTEAPASASLIERAEGVIPGGVSFNIRLTAPRKFFGAAPSVQLLEQAVAALGRSAGS